MRALERNKQTIYYANFVSSERMTDEYGNETGEIVQTYSTPSPLKVNVSAAKGENATRQFGETENYDKVIVTDDINCPITETSRLWVDTNPIEIIVEEESQGWSAHDYIVKRVATSLNSASIAISKVNISV